jgi:hypothetical protein
MWVYHTRSCSGAPYICLRQRHKREDIVWILIYYTTGCCLTAFLCLRAVSMSAVTNTRFSHCALSYRLSSFAKWTVPVADILQIQSNWLHKSHSESLNLTSSHSRSLRTEPTEWLLMDFSSFWRRFRKISEKAAISFVMSVRLSVRVEQLGSHRKEFHEIWYFEGIFWKVQVSLTLILLMWRIEWAHNNARK